MNTLISVFRLSLACGLTLLFCLLLLPVGRAQLAMWSFENITSSVPDLPIAPSSTDTGVSGRATMAGGTNIGSPEGCYSSETWATNFWPTSTGRVPDEYLEFRISTDDETTIAVTRFAFESQATSTNSALDFDVYYSTNNFGSEHFLFSGAHTTGANCSIRSGTLDIAVLPGRSLTFRIYPYGQAAGAQAASIRLDDVMIMGDFLPVELTEFTARRDGTAVLLQWTTATELNNAYFAVERSEHDLRFREIGRLSGAGNSNTELHYSFTDQAPPATTLYYRLRQVDLDGTSTYYDVLAIEAVEDLLTDRIWPIPARDVIHIETATGSSAELIRLLHPSGRLIHCIEPTPGAKQYEIPVRELPGGTYYLQIGEAGRRRAYRIVKIW